MADISAVTTDTFDAEVIQASGPVLVDFWAPWCGPCRAMAPVLEGLAKELSDSLRVVKLNVDDHPEVAARFGIQSIPTLLLFKDGSVADTIVGYTAENELKERLSRVGVAASG